MTGVVAMEEDEDGATAATSTAPTLARGVVPVNDWSENQGRGFGFEVKYDLAVYRQPGEDFRPSFIQYFAWPPSPGRGYGRFVGQTFYSQTVAEYDPDVDVHGPTLAVRVIRIGEV